MPLHLLYTLLVSRESAHLQFREGQAKYSRLKLFNFGEMSCFNQYNAVQ